MHLFCILMEKEDHNTLKHPQAIQGKPLRGGVHPPGRKNTADAATRQMPPPKTVLLSLLQHVGAPCKPLVSVGDEVRVGQIIGDNPNALCAPVHASVSGKVVAIRDIILPGGAAQVPAVEIESDGRMQPVGMSGPVEVQSAEDLVRAAQDAGLVGLGGAGFPTHVKLAGALRAGVDTLLINAAECEPYVTADDRECREYPDDILEGIGHVLRWLPVKNACIVVEDNKPQAIRALAEALERHQYAGVSPRLMTLRAKYPQGAEKMLIKSATGRVVPAGGLPFDVGVLVMNVTTVAALARYLRTGVPLVSRRVTVDGPAVKEPANVQAPIGTPVGEILAFLGQADASPAKLLMGGPMMGLSLYDAGQPLLKQNNAILIWDAKSAAVPEPSACLRCGRCVRACPMYLRPVDTEKAWERGNVDDLLLSRAEACIECGCCSYVCPAHRPLVQIMRLAKARLRDLPKSEVKP